MKQQEIRELMKFFDETGINRIKIKNENFEIELEKHSQDEQVVACPTPAPAPINVVVNEKTQVQTPKSHNESIKSPMVGTFYAAPSPGAAPFAKVGQTIRKGDVVCIIEAMKIMNEIQAEFDCKILEILVADGQPVEFGMPVFGVEKI